MRSSPAAPSPTQSWPCCQKNSFLRQLTEQAKMEYATRSIAGGTTDGASLLSARAGRGRRCRAGLRSGSVACWMTVVS